MINAICFVIGAVATGFALSGIAYVFGQNAADYVAVFWLGVASYLLGRLHQKYQSGCVEKERGDVG